MMEAGLLLPTTDRLILHTIDRQVLLTMIADPATHLITEVQHHLTIDHILLVDLIQILQATVLQAE